MNNNTALPLEIQQLEKSLDLTGFINEVEKLLATPITVEGSTPFDYQGSSKEIWPTDEDRKEDLKDLYNFKTVGKRKWLQNILLEDSEDEDCEVPITDEDLKILLKIHKYRRKCQKKYHTDISNSQYTYYAAGLLSEEDKFPEHQQHIRNLFGAKSGISDDFGDYCEKPDHSNKKRRTDSCASALSFGDPSVDKEKPRRRPPSGKSGVKRAQSVSVMPPHITLESPAFDSNMSSPMGPTVKQEFLSPIHESAVLHDHPFRGSTTETFLTPALPVFSTNNVTYPCEMFEPRESSETTSSAATVPPMSSATDTEEMVILSIPSPKAEVTEALEQFDASHIDTAINSVVLSSETQPSEGQIPHFDFSGVSSTSLSLGNHTSEPQLICDQLPSSDVGKSVDVMVDCSPEISTAPATTTPKSVKKTSKKPTKAAASRSAMGAGTSLQTHSRSGVVGLSKCFIADATEEEIDQMRRKVWQKIASEEVPKIYTEKYIFRKYRAIVAKDIAMWCQRKVEEKLNPQGTSGSKSGKSGKTSAGARNTRSSTAKGKAKPTPKKAKP